jgi:hypothetical protein
MNSDLVIVGALKLAQVLLCKNLPPKQNLTDAATILRLREVIGSPSIRSALERPSSPSSVLFKFLGDQGEANVFDPHAVRILVAAFDGAWQSIKARGLNFRISKLNSCGKTLQST